MKKRQRKLKSRIASWSARDSQPDDVAAAVVFLASDAAWMVSGATYDVTAGDSAHYELYFQGIPAL